MMINTFEAKPGIWRFSVSHLHNHGAGEFDRILFTREFPAGSRIVLQLWRAVVVVVVVGELGGPDPCCSITACIMSGLESQKFQNLLHNSTGFRFLARF
jgi:hypothetical protein